MTESEQRQLAMDHDALDALRGETDARVWAREARANAAWRKPVVRLASWFAAAIEAGRNAGYAQGYESGLKDGGRGKITMDQASDLAQTYGGGEGNHPLARHRDSMG